MRKNEGYWKNNDRQQTIQVVAKKNGTVRYVVLWGVAECLVALHMND